MITIKGRIPSKKNSVIITMRNNKVMKFPSNDYRTWHKDASQQIELQKRTLFSGDTGTEKLGTSITIIFYAHDARKYDLSNKAESIMDLLVDCGLLEDDNYEFVSELILKFGGLDRENPRAEIYG